MTYYIGIDPDLHHTGVAIISDDRREPWVLEVIRVPSKYKGVEATIELANRLRDLSYCVVQSFFGSNSGKLIVESQEIYPGAKARPNDILHLGQAAGVIVGSLLVINQGLETTLVNPKDWKGQTEKERHQAVLLDHLHWRQADALKTHGIKPNEWTHVLDAFGLATWGLLRDAIPRDPSRPAGASVQGKIVSSDRLARLESRFGRANQ